MSRYYDNYIAHSWGDDPKSKTKEKSYNAAYYKKNKDKILAKRIENAKKRATEIVKSAEKGKNPILNDITKVVKNAVDISRKAFLEATKKAKNFVQKHSVEISDWAKKNAKNEAEERSDQNNKHPSKANKKSNRKHKYLLKVTENGYTRYFYTQKEIDAYNRNKAKDKQVLDHLKHKGAEDPKQHFKDMNIPALDGQNGEWIEAVDSTLDDRRKTVSTYSNMSDEEYAAFKDQVYDAFSVNPNYNTTGDDLSFPYNTNCAYCTATYDLRQRGYDVTADAQLDDYQGTPREIQSWYEGGKFTYEKGQSSSTSPKEAGNKVLKDIEKTYEPGARGQLCVYWQGGGGHSLSFQVLPNGKAVIFDSQAFDLYDSDSIGNLFEYVDYTKSGSSCYMRTDDLPVTDEVLSTVAGENVSEKRKWF